MNVPFYPSSNSLWLLPDAPLLLLDKINDQLCSRLDLLKPPPFLYAAGSSAVQVLVYTYITSTVLDLPQDLKLCPFR